MRHESARPTHDQGENAPTSATSQPQPATRVGTDMPAGVIGNPGAVGGWARRLTAELESVLLDTLGLAATIEWHLHRWQKCTGIACELALNNAAGIDLPEECAATLFHIYSEALSNVVRHARAGRVVIVLAITPREVALTVRDNGIGLGEQASRASRGGIAGMRARAQSHRGLCEFFGGPSAGTTVTAILPIARSS